jgi:large subunit ribosomal protein L15
VANLQIHHLKPAPGAHPVKTRVGRGDASKGKTAGRGTKGSKARGQIRVGFEGGQLPLHMRLPKKRGFNHLAKVNYQLVNLQQLAKHFPQGGKIDSAALVAKGLVRKHSLVKLLGDGEITASYHISVDKVSQNAKAKIEAAKGSIDA